MLALALTDGDAQAFEEAIGVRRVYLNEDCSVWCIVDAIDYEWATRWRWHYVYDRHGRKRYAARNTRRRGESPKQIKVFMHKDILLRSGKPQPTTAHHIGDHDDGDSLNNRRGNLDWATPAMNRASARARQ